jgi:transcription elongation factor Elf1
MAGADLSGHVPMTLAATSSERLFDCPVCEEIERARAFKTVHAVYFFCSACAHAWSIERTLTFEHWPERRIARG